MKKILGNEKGVVAIIIAVGLVALMLAVALTIDVGSLFEERRLLQTVADSAALAGAQELPEDPDEAIQKAVDYANNNYGENVDSIDVEISSTLATDDTITVTVLNPDAPLYFARVTGKDSTLVGASAKAVIASPEVVSDMVPWGIPIDVDELSSGGEYVLKYGAGPEGNSYSGNFQALELDKPGGREYRNNIAEGALSVLRIWDPEEPDPYEKGMIVKTKTGNLVGPTEEGTNERVDGDWDDFFLDLTEDDGQGGYKLKKPDTQFCIVPIISELTYATGKSTVKILGFACFIITEIQDMQNDPEYGNGVAVVGRFLNMALVDTDGSIIAVGSSSLRVIRLIK